MPHAVQHAPAHRVQEENLQRRGVAAPASRRHADGRVVSVLEGGYDLDALARSVDAHVQVLREADRR